MAQPNKEDTVSEVEKVSKILSAAQSGDVDLFWAAAMQLSGGEGGVQEIREERGRTALHFAAQAGHLQLCKYLLVNLNFNVNAQDKKGDTALTLAAAAGQEEVVDMLLQHGADPQLYKVGTAGPLHRAAGAGSAAVVRRLLRAGADVNATSESGPPLFWAAGSGHADVILLLLKAGADPNRPSQQGMTSLAMAAAVGCLEGVKVLVEGGARVDAVVQGGFTALHIAAESGNEEMVDFLLKAGAVPDVKDEQGKTPMRVAAEVGHNAIVSTLARSSLGTVDEAGASGSTETEDMHEDGSDDSDEDVEDDDDEDLERREAALQRLSVLSSGSLGSSGEGNEGMAEMFREKANEFFLVGDYAGAVQLYTLALQHCTRSPVLWGNRSAAHMKLGEEELALQDARASRTVDPGYAKGWYREGIAASALGRWGDAVAAYEALSRLQPHCQQVAKLLKEAQQHAAGQ